MNIKKKFRWVFLVTIVMLIITTTYSMAVWEKNFAKRNTHASKEGIVLSATDEKLAAAQWATYHNDTYGFELKYPGDWASPKEEDVSDTDYNYIHQISFGTNEAFGGENSEGFSVYVYNNSVCLPQADNFQLKENDPSRSISELIAGSATANKACTTHRIIISSEFYPKNVDTFQYVGTNYTFVVVPFVSRNQILSDHIQSQLGEVEKSFQVMAQNPIVNNPTITSSVIFSNNNLVKSAPVQSVRPRGIMVCPDPGQKPSYSKTKGKHMDEDCCPDPDEWANPKCAYPASAHGILRAVPKK